MDMDVDDVKVCPGEVLQQEAAQVLSQIRDSCKTTQKAADTVVNGVDKLLTLFLDVLKEKFDDRLKSRSGYIKLTDVHAVIDIFKGQSLFAGVGSKSRLEYYIQEKSAGRDVALQKVVLESKTVIRAGKPYSKPTKFGYRVSFLPQLEQLLNCEDVLECVLNPEPSEDGIFKSVTDGLFYQYHPVVQKAKESNTPVLAFNFHVDDVDPCDALKSKSGNQNLRMFYWTLLNIPPEKRSTLRAINLLAIVKTTVAKQKGNKIFMQDFIDVLMKLGTEGLELTIRGKKMKFFGLLLFGAADNPAAANIGGFKETHSALRPCRVCLVKSGEMCNHFREDLDLLRKIIDHNKYVDLVLLYKDTSEASSIEVVNINDVNIDSGMDEELIETPLFEDSANPSVNYGINGKSILADLPGFIVTSCLPQDVLHLLAEGVVELVCRLVLRDLCVPPKVPNRRLPPLLSLRKVNEAIQTVANLGHLNSSKPSLITMAHITGKKLKQSASQMLVLVKLLPFLIFNVCPQAKITLVVLLNQLVDMCMSYEFSEIDITLLGNLIEEFGNSFKELYPKVKTLKLHCLVHLPTQIRLFGPLRQHACFHFESMHGKFTSLAPVINNMKNFAFSTASRNLIARSAEIMKDSDTGKYLYAGDVLKGTTNVSVETLVEKNCLLNQFPHLNENSCVTKVTQIVQHSNQWREGVAFLLEKCPQEVFGRISAIYVIEGEYVFVFNKYETVMVRHLNAFQISKCNNEFHSVKFSDLSHKFPIARISFNLKKAPLAYLLLESIDEERKIQIQSGLAYLQD